MPPGEGRKPAKQPGGACDALGLGKPGVCRDADACRVVWARVKGYPWWPAQILSKAAARAHLGGVTHKSKSDAPVIFFGTSEIAWIGAKDLTNWEEGMRQSFHNRGRKNKKFVVALEQVRDFLSLTNERVAPQGWWCAAPARGASPVPEEPPSSDDDEPEPEEAPPEQQQQQPEQQQQQQALDPQAAQQAHPAAAALLQQQAAQHEAVAAAAAAAAAGYGGGRFGSDASGGYGAAAAMEEDDEDAADLQQAAATAAALMKRGLNARHAGAHADDAAPAQQRSGSASGRPGSRAQIWGGGGGGSGSARSGSRPGSDHGSRDAAQPGGRSGAARKRRAAYSYSSDSAASDSSEEEAEPQPDSSDDEGGRRRPARRGRAARGRGRAGAGAARGRGRQQQLQQQQEAAAAAGSGALRGLSSLPPRKRQLLLQEQQQQQREVTASESETESLAIAAMAIAELAHSCSWDHQPRGGALPAGAGAAAAQPQPPAAEQQHEQLPLEQLPQHDALVQQALPEPAPRGQLLRVRLEVRGDSVGVGLSVADEASAGSGLCVPDAPPGHYVHSGCGLPCDRSWQYSVAMPGAAPAAAAAAGSGSAASPQQPPQDDEDAAVVPEQPPGSQAAAQQVPPVSACSATSYYCHLFAGFALPASVHAADEADGLEDEDMHDALLAEGEAEQQLLDGGAGPAAAGGGGRSRPSQLAVAAANAAIIAAFSSSPAQGHHHHHHHHHAQQQQQQQAPQQAAAAAAHGHHVVPAAGARGGSGSWQRRRNNANAASSAAAAVAAVAAAAAHVLTPPHVLDALVLELLLHGGGPLLPHMVGQPDTGFTLPRGLLLNRPPKFECLKRNLYVSRERPKRQPKDEISVCSCRPERVRTPDGSETLTGCGEHCLNRLSFIHCDPRTCPCGPACSNKPFHLLRAPPLDVFLTENRGHGVRLTAPLGRGEFVVEYAGEVIDQAELRRRMDAARDSGEQHFYIMELQPGLFIDARKKGNQARLLNSCCEPNCETQKWRDAATGEVRIGIFTTRPVGCGEELTYDYMFEHSGVSAMAQGFKCQCGARNCRGTMDINPERRRDWGRRVEVYWEGDGVFYPGTVTGYSSSSCKHIIMYDDGDLERVRLDQVPHRWLDLAASPCSAGLAPAGSPAPGAELVPHSGAGALHVAVAAAAAAGGADSGSWSQTEQEAAAAEDGGSSGARGLLFQQVGSPTAGRPGGPRRSLLGLAPLQQGQQQQQPCGHAGSSYLERATAAAAGLAGAGGYGADDEDAADALVTLGLAAEAELEQQRHAAAAARAADELLAAQTQQLLLMRQAEQGMPQTCVELFQRPAAKRQRVGGAYAGDAAQQQQQQALRHAGLHPAWQHSSSASSQSACHLAAQAGGLDTPLSPSGRMLGLQQQLASWAAPGHQHGAAAGAWGAPPGAAAYAAPQAAARQQQQQQRASAAGAHEQGAPVAMELDGEGGEFLPWEQLLSGITAIKSQGPALFQQQAAPEVAQRQAALQREQQQQQQQDEAAQPQPASSASSCARKFGQLLSLVSQMQPAIQERQADAGPLPPVALSSRLGSWGCSSTSSTASMQLPLFCSSGGGSHAQREQAAAQAAPPQPPAAVQQLRAGSGSSPLPSAGSTTSSRTQLLHAGARQPLPAPPPAAGGCGAPQLPQLAMGGACGQAAAAQPGHSSLAGSNSSSPSFPSSGGAAAAVPAGMADAALAAALQQQQQHSSGACAESQRQLPPGAGMGVRLGSAGSGGSSASAASVLPGAPGAAAGAPALVSVLQAQAVAQ